MLKKALTERQGGNEYRLRDLHLKKARIEEELTAVDRAIWSVEGALGEIAQTLRDLETQAAIDAAKGKEEA